MEKARKENNYCGDCESYVDEVIHCGDPTDWDSRYNYICKECLLKALKLFEKIR